MKKEQNNRLLLLLIVVMVSILLVSCGTDTVPHETKEQDTDVQLIEKATEVYVEYTEVTEEPTVALQGEYTLEESKSLNGVFIAYEDGSFDKYPAGGYCYGLTSGGRLFYGMFMRDYYADITDSVKSETNLVVFADKEYSLTLHPIHAEVAVFSTNTSDGTIGYGKISQMNERGVPTRIYYRNNDTEDIYPLYINGDKATEYDAEYITWSVHPFKGTPSKAYTYQLWGYKKDSTVSLGIGEGTSLVEKEYSVDATYYDCDYERNNWQDEDVYYVEGIPTSQGYAEVDFSGVPNGRYVMVYDIGDTYWAMLLILDR